MRKYFISICIIPAFIIFLQTACTKSDPLVQAPVPQTIVTADSSGFTGKLVVNFSYQSGQIYYPKNVSVQLYASHNDLITSQNTPNTNLSIYSINSGNSHSVNFGYIIQGNYYMYASTMVDQTLYTLESVVQVLPQRSNVRNMTLLPLRRTDQ